MNYDIDFSKLSLAELITYAKNDHYVTFDWDFNHAADKHIDRLDIIINNEDGQYSEEEIEHAEKIKSILF